MRLPADVDIRVPALCLVFLLLAAAAHAQQPFTVGGVTAVPGTIG